MTLRASGAWRVAPPGRREPGLLAHAPMRAPRRFALFFTLAVVAACGSGSASPELVDPATDGGASPSASGGDGGSSSRPGAPSTEPSGLCGALRDCSGACVSLDESNTHCGACGKACDAGQVCLNASCRVGACTDFGRLACGDACVDPDTDPAHCGACGKACGAGKLCANGACVASGGDGTSCASPLLFPPDTRAIAFTLADAPTTGTKLSCGDLEARPARAFRFTADRTKKGARFSVQGGLASDDLALEYYATAACDGAGALGCNDDADATDKRPQLDVDLEAGKTYFLVVSSKGPAPRGRFTLDFDD